MSVGFRLPPLEVQHAKRALPVEAALLPCNMSAITGDPGLCTVGSNDADAYGDTLRT